MAGEGFLLSEAVVSFAVLSATLISYVLLLSISLALNSTDRLQYILMFFQLLALSTVPLILTLLNRPGLTNDAAGVRLLEELALQVLRYRYIIRPLLG